MRKQTPKRIYLDHAATTPVDERVMRAMRPYFGAKFGNAGSVHSFGQEAIGAVDTAREIIAEALGAKFNEVIFAGSATEANNLALRGAVKAFSGERLVFSKIGDTRSPKIHAPRPRVIISSIEHESVLETARELGRGGAELVIVPVNRAGIVDLKKLEAALNERTAIVSVMFANNEMGVIQPIAKISEILRAFRVERSAFSGDSKKQNSDTLYANRYPLLHTDAAQAFQYLDCSSGAPNADLLTISAHKICGPKGVGALYLRRGGLTTNHYPLTPIITGGGQEFGYRSGTENTPLIAGFGRAASLAIAAREKEAERIRELRNYFWREFKRIFESAEINGDLSKALPNILNIFIPGQEAQFFLTKLDMLGIAASSGSACSARSLKPPYVIEALGHSAERAKNSVRFSFGRATTEKELIEALRRIRSAFGRQN